MLTGGLLGAREATAAAEAHRGGGRCDGGAPRAEADADVAVVAPPAAALIRLRSSSACRCRGVPPVTACSPPAAGSTTPHPRLRGPRPIRRRWPSTSLCASRCIACWCWKRVVWLPRAGAVAGRTLEQWAPRALLGVAVPAGVAGEAGVPIAEASRTPRAPDSAAWARGVAVGGAWVASNRRARGLACAPWAMLTGGRLASLVTRPCDAGRGGVRHSMMSGEPCSIAQGLSRAHHWQRIESQLRPRAAA